ncbi:MAG: T9SS type A sorting domain-containing protein [Ignavibacteriales bacterium]|nr:T9SS type A sorting domain-containing protein [Ignavibacteriales bacterium]
MKERAFVSLEVFNALGQQVVVLLNDQLEAGSYNVLFEGSTLSTGVYMYRLQANGIRFAKKMTLIK